jgi:hypothetical protein
MLSAAWDHLFVDVVAHPQKTKSPKTQPQIIIRCHKFSLQCRFLR